MQSTEIKRIHQLPSEVVDQIAAGEVVERPAHLVKELVENAIDAGATSVEIEFDQGGRRIRVTDNGLGIEPEDLALALARHATSKITEANDLWNLMTFGFRGEALASIAAVSRLTLQSRPQGAELAACVRSEFGRLSKVEPIGGNPGTTVLVEELFSNIPARLKFLKSEAGETAQIKATLRALALANEGVEFRLRTKGKLEQVWPKAQSFLERAQQILEVDKLFNNTFNYKGFTTQVVFASPHDVTGNARGILIFVQNRWVQDRSLQAAVIEAYRGLLMHGEYPIAVVRLQASPDEVDVNIHPTKSAVKFRDSQSAFRSVNRALREALEKAPWLEQSAAADHADGVIHAVSVSSMKAELARTQGVGRKLSVADLTRPYSAAGSSKTASAVIRDSTVLTPDQGGSVETNEIGTQPQAGTPQPETLATAPVYSVGRFEAPEFDTVVFKQKVDLDSSALSHTRDVNAMAPFERAPIGSSKAHIEANQFVAETRGHWSRLQVVGQANLTYIVAQDADRLVLVDQHAAHERVAYERLMKAWMTGAVDVQPLLIPITVDLEPDGAEALVSISEELEKLGVQIDQIGPQSIAVRTQPLAIKESALVKALAELAREMVDRGGSFALERKISDLCATMACHSVVRAGQALSHEQMKSLLVQMDEFPLSSFCPHGRPVSVDYPYTRLERDFGRLV